MVNVDNKYTKMQLNLYNSLASGWLGDKDLVVGSFDAHNAWEDYKYLFENLGDVSDKIALDFACGPGRNIVKYKNTFKQIDGVDISPVNISNAKIYLDDNGVQNSVLYSNNGIDLSDIPADTYDIIMSTIAMQHICVYDIRKSYLKEFYRVLKSSGSIAIQMGYGSPSPMSVGYYENFYDAENSNRGCDVCIESTEQLEKDLLEIGFTDFKFTIDKVGPGDVHPQWIYFNATK